MLDVSDEILPTEVKNNVVLPYISNSEAVVCDCPEDEQLRKIYDDLNEYYKEISDHNTSLINSFGKNASKHFKDLLNFCDVTEKIELVDEPNGDEQNENYGMFKNVHVDQWSTGMEGDSFAGYIYANVNGQWIKVPYSC